MLEPDHFYVYVHCRRDTNEPVYVGKGSGVRAWWRWGRNRYWHAIHRAVGLRIGIVAHSLTEAEAYELEVETIGRLRRDGVPLVNLSPGGRWIPPWKRDQQPTPAQAARLQTASK